MASAHPLVTPGSWVLRTGAGGIALVRHGAAAFWGLGAVMALCWLGALVHESLVWGARPGVLAMAGIVVSVWGFVCWSTWFAWRRSQAILTLSWGGPQGPGFQVAQWRAAVEVHVLLDLQRWMLLRLSSLEESKQGGHQAWVWLDLGGRLDAPDPALHQLRTLLYMAPGMKGRMRARKAPHDGGVALSLSRAVASWAHTFRSGTTLRTATSPSIAAKKPGIAAVDMADMLFPPTQILTADDTSWPQEGAPRKEMRP